MECKLLVLYNKCYGGFSYSTKAIEEYNKRLPAGSTPIDESVEDDIRRDDPVMVQVCKELGPKANGEYANIAIKELPIKFKNCFYIREYDGRETVHIDIKGYRLDRIKRILQDDSLSSEVKLQMVQDALDEVVDMREYLRGADTDDTHSAD